MRLPHLCQSPGDGHAHIGQHRGRDMSCLRETVPCPHIPAGRERTCRSGSEWTVSVLTH